MKEQVTFGYPEFWPKIYQTHKVKFEAIRRDTELADAIFHTVEMRGAFQIVIFMLVRMTATALNELLMLVGNGAGAGALKISRGMFETAVMAEYLRQHPVEVHDYLDYGKVISWKRMQQAMDLFSSEQIQDAKDNYDRVKPRFENQKGQVRERWNKNSISYMTRKIGRGDQYDLPYSIAASIHHGNQEALLAYLEHADGHLEIDQPPSMAWIDQALLGGHLYLLQSLETLNDSFQLQFDERLKAANDEFLQVWGKG